MTPAKMENRPLLTRTLTERRLEALARELAAKLGAGDVMLLEGPLGSGKSVFARAIIRALSGRQDLEVPSPSFSLRQEYEAAKTNGAVIRHFDLYRLKNEAELEALEIDNPPGACIDLIEWPTRLGSRAPADALRVSLSLAEARGERRIELSGGPTWRDRLKDLVVEEPAE